MAEADAQRRSARRSRRSLVAVLALVVLAGAPNLLWLTTSTLRIENAAGRDVETVAWRACRTTRTVGRMAPRASTFGLLQSCGDDTLVVLVEGRARCHVYVEGSLYHVDAAIAPDGSVRCSYADPFTTFLLEKLL